MSVVEYAWVSDGSGERKWLLADPRLVLIVEDSPNSWMLWEFAETGEHAGDTWHETHEKARAQAIHELGDRLGPWVQVDWSHDRAREEARLLVLSEAEE
jgi:hypothetical protein